MLWADWEIAMIEFEDLSAVQEAQRPAQAVQNATNGQSEYALLSTEFNTEIENAKALYASGVSTPQSTGAEVKVAENYVNQPGNSTHITDAAYRGGPAGFNNQNLILTQAAPAANSKPEQGKSESVGCGVISGPTYTQPGGTPLKKDATIQPQWARNARFPIAPFYSGAKFAKDEIHDPSCCRVRQYIWVSKELTKSAQEQNGLRFPYNISGADGKTPEPEHWYEDSNATLNFHYGDRTAEAQDPHINQYTTNGQPDREHGDTYDGFDQPGAFPNWKGKVKFKLTVNDVCHGDRVIKTGPTITIPWDPDKMPKTDK